MWKRLTDLNSLTWFLVAGGLFLRLWHYVANHTIWYDEAVLLLNVMDKDFAGLLGPLHHAVAAPPLFVWLLKLIHLTAGDVPYVWRAVPFVSGVAGLLVTVPLARKVLDPPAAVLAVGLVAVSDWAVWLGCCIKPYAGDAAIVAGLLLYLKSTDGWPAVKRLLVLAAFAPPVLCFSYTSVFALGGLMAAMLPAVWKGGWRAWAAWAVAAAAIGGTVLVLYFGPMKAQRDPNLFREWKTYLADYDNPAGLPFWLIQAVSGVFHYACNPSGLVLTLFAPVGAWGLWKAGRREVVIAGVGAFVLSVVAAGMKAYPFGQSRLSFYLSPAAILLGAAGVGEVIRRWKWVGVGLAVLLVAVGDGLSLYHLVVPWPVPQAATVHKHVQANRQPGDVILSDDASTAPEDAYRGNYRYFFYDELKPLKSAADVPVGGRVWVVMDHYGPDVRTQYIEHRLRPLGFERQSAFELGPPSDPGAQAAAYLYVRK